LCKKEDGVTPVEPKHWARHRSKQFSLPIVERAYLALQFLFHISGRNPHGSLAQYLTRSPINGVAPDAQAVRQLRQLPRAAQISLSSDANAFSRRRLYQLATQPSNRFKQHRERLGSFIAVDLTHAAGERTLLEPGNRLLSIQN